MAKRIAAYTLVFAEVSMNLHLSLAARASPSSFVTARFSTKSH